MTAYNTHLQELNQYYLSAVVDKYFRVLIEKSLVIADFGLLSQNPNLQYAIFINCHFDKYPDFYFCYYLGQLYLSNCQLSQFTISSDYIEEISLDHNSLTTLNLECKNLLKLDVSYNYLQTTEFLLTLQALTELDLSFNKIRKLQFPSFSNLTYVNVYNNFIELSEFRKFIPLLNLSELVFTSPDVSSLYEARNILLGELMARYDEISNAIGKNNFQEKYVNSASFDKQYFEKMRKRAEKCLIAPIDYGRAVISVLLPYLLRINDEELKAEDIIYYKSWLCPKSEMLSMCGGIWYE